MTVGGWCRALRAGVFAAVCVLLAALGHVTMSGTSVPWWTMAVGAMAIGAVGWFLADRERGPALIVTVVVAAQTVLHEMFSLGQTMMPGRTSDAGATAAAMGGMDMGSSDAMSMDAMSMSGMTHMSHGWAGAVHTHGMAGMGGSASFGMLAAHLLAAVLCGLWLAYGERAAFRVLRAAAARLVGPLRMLLALPVADRRPSVRRRRDDAHRSSLARFLLCYAVTSRGPPSAAVV